MNLKIYLPGLSLAAGRICGALESGRADQIWLETA